MADIGSGARLPATLHSPERAWRVAVCVLLALVAAWQFAIRTGSGAGIALGCLLATALLATAWRVWRTRLVADSRGLTDFRATRAVRVRWEEIAGFEVVRPAGPWGGFCVRAVRRAGRPVDLFGTRGYSLLPSLRVYNEVYRMMWTLEDLRPAVP